jgi:PEGA domain
MQPSWRLCVCASLAMLLSLSVLASRAPAKNLTITSTPPGARVEVNGIFAGTTPYTSDFPGGYFHKPHTVFGARLDHAMVVTISKNGYASEKLTLTNGPFVWLSVNGRRHGNYFLLKSKRFDIHLDPVSTGDARPIETIDGEGPMRPAKAEDFSEPQGRSQERAGTIAISSNPARAEIYVDGQFEGQTPATLRLSGGLHHFQVKFAGGQNWERDLDVLAGSKLTLDAIPAPSP